MELREAIHDLSDEQEYKGDSPATIEFYRTNLDHFLRDTGVTEATSFTERSTGKWLIEHPYFREEVPSFGTMGRHSEQVETNPSGTQHTGQGTGQLPSASVRGRHRIQGSAASHRGGSRLLRGADAEGQESGMDPRTKGVGSVARARGREADGA